MCFTVECLRSVSAPREQVRSVAAFAAYKTENQKLLMKVNFQHSFWFCFCTYSLQHEISGVDALRGHTRSHPEHDG